MEHLSNVDNTILNKYASSNKRTSKHIYSGIILTKKEIGSKLLKVVKSSKVDDVIKNWIYDKMIIPVNSTTFATNHSFEELLTNVKTAALSDDQIEEINNQQRSFGEGLDIDTNNFKPEDKVRDMEAMVNEETRLVSANKHLSEHLQKFAISSINSHEQDVLKLNIDFINSKNNIGHSIPFELHFEGNKVNKCLANINGKQVPLNKLLNSFSTNKILSLYLANNKRELNAGPIVLTEESMRRKLATVVTKSSIDRVLDTWLKENKIDKLNEKTFASKFSVEELLNFVDDNYLISEEEINTASNKKSHFGKELKIKTDTRTKDTGVREAEEQDWNKERKQLHATNEISKLFKEHEVISFNDNKDGYVVQAVVNNPHNGIRTEIGFNFEQSEGKLKNIVSIQDSSGENVKVSQINELLKSKVDKVSEQFNSHNRISSRNYNSLISKTNLTNKLKTITSSHNIKNIFNFLIENNEISPINSVTYATNHSINELVHIATQNGLIEEDKVDTHKQLLSRESSQKVQFNNRYDMDSDTRELKATERELTPQMLKAKGSLKNSIIKAASIKKLTLNKERELIEELNNSKTAQDLEKVAKELKRYL